MKLIIDIPEEWENMKFCDVVNREVIKNGTPLDEIRSQIIALPKASFWSDENDDAICREDVLEILNDYNT